MTFTTALLLAGDGDADAASRRPAAHGGSRHLFPLANRPILFHNLETLREAGVREVAILSHGEGGRAIGAAVADGGDWGMEVSHREWAAVDGMAAALAAGRELFGSGRVLVQEGGALMRERLQTHMTTFGREQLDALALAFVTPGGAAAEGPGYLFGPRAVGFVLDHGCAPNPIAGIRARGGRVRVQRVDGCLPGDGDLDTLLESNRRVLEGLRPSVVGVLLDDSEVQGAVDVHPSATVCRSLLRGPLVIGAGACITDAYIGPYTSIGAGTVVEGSELEHSIVLPEAELRFVGTRIESSIIGRGAKVRRGFDVPGALRVALGDGAEVVLR